jgi:hypothetical protein
MVLATIRTVGVNMALVPIRDNRPSWEQARTKGTGVSTMAVTTEMVVASTVVVAASPTSATIRAASIRGRATIKQRAPINRFETMSAGGLTMH